MGYPMILIAIPTTVWGSFLFQPDRADDEYFDYNHYYFTRRRYTTTSLPGRLRTERLFTNFRWE